MKARRLISTYLQNLMSMNLIKVKYLSWKALGMSLKEKWSKQMKVKNSPSPHPNHQETRRDTTLFPFLSVSHQTIPLIHPHPNHSTQNSVNSQNPLHAPFQTARGKVKKRVSKTKRDLFIWLILFQPELSLWKVITQEI